MVDMVGRRCGRLVVFRKSEVINSKGELYWVCLCDCGAEVVVNGCRLRNGNTRSCGCVRSDAKKTHGMTGNATYRSWNHMKQRCYNSNNHAYYRYGGRGIKVCERWDSFESFFVDMGERPSGTSIGRLDNNCDYAPGNCRWETPKQQANNRRAKHNRR